MVIKNIVLNLMLGLTMCSYSQQLQYEGILNDPSVDPDYGKGHEAITASIKENLAYLNLFEYSHALPELYPLVENGIIKPRHWRKFIDSLEQIVKEHQNDTIRPYWAVDYFGLISLQAQFFIATLNKNDKLNTQYPIAYKVLKENTSIMDNMGYKITDYDSLLIFSEVVGETNFWYFFQLEDCRFVTEVIRKDQSLIKRFRAATSSLDIVSTYKVPYYLQRRKIKSLQSRLRRYQEPLCQEAAMLMNNRSIMINDKDRNYFKASLKDGIDEDKLKNF